MSNEIVPNVRRRCLAPATGQHLCIIYDSGNTYYYVVYRNRLKSAYLAYSTDGVTWTAEKLLIKAAGLTIVNGISLALDHTNKKIYAVYSEVSVSGSDIKVAVIDCSTPNNPVLGSEYIITGYSDYYDMPVCALGVDGGLHVGAIRYNFGGVTTTYYVVKSGIAVVQPDLTSWSSVFNVGNCNHANYYGNMKIVAHPDNNRLVILCYKDTGASREMYRSLNTTGAWDGWMALATGGLGLLSMSTSYVRSITTQPYDMGVISGWNYAYIIAHYSSLYVYSWVYNFMGDTGIGNFPMIRSDILWYQVTPTSVLENSDVGVAACLYPGDYHAHFFLETNVARDLWSRSYSYVEDYLSSLLAIETSTYDPSCITSVWYPFGVYGNKICFLEMDQ